MWVMSLRSLRSQRNWRREDLKSKSTSTLKEKVVEHFFLFGLADKKKVALVYMSATETGLGHTKGVADEKQA
jgi:hypothetical protein